MTMRTFISGLAAVAIMGSACGNDGAPATSAGAPSVAHQAVDVQDFTFAPSRLTVPVGTTVSWTNRDRFGHTATSGTPANPTDDFDVVLGLTTDKDATGMAGSTTFAVAGTYEYFCRYHPSMVGSVTVS